MDNTDAIVRALAGGPAQTPTADQLLALSRSNAQQPGALDPNQAAVQALLGDPQLQYQMPVNNGMQMQNQNSLMDSLYAMPTAQPDANGNPAYTYGAE